VIEANAVKLRTLVSLGEHFLLAADILFDVEPSVIPQEEQRELRRIIGLLEGQALMQGYVGYPKGRSGRR
jgi:hypothetical protein